MEDDDEFGDLYTDVLQPLQMSSAPPPPPPIQSTPQPPPRSADLTDRIPSDDEEILYGSKSSINLNPNLNLNNRDGAAVKTENYSPARVLGKVEDLNFEDDNNKSKEDMMEENFGIEEAGEEEFLIPGLSSSGARVLERGGGELPEGNDDWDDSDSEDDLQIVLNDNTGPGMMGMDGGGVGLDGEDDDGDGDNLVIVTGDVDPNHHLSQMNELQDWGEDASQGVEGGERKDLLGGDAGKGDGGGAVAQKTGYSSLGYHPFHSQFKYVRPGAAPMPGAGPVATGGAPGQVRPPGSLLSFAGRGRGEWHPAGMKNVPPNMQKNFHPGWNNGAGRGFGSGLDFTLPSHKTIFEVDIDGFEEKPWRLQGIDISEFFNFGMNEETWKEYCKQLELHRLEATMQSKIRVYESGRTEQEYDPDLPPELAAAAGHDIPSENRNFVKSDVQIDLTKGSVRSRMQLPTGKAIQVETGFGERLPSIDTRPPRMRDSDAIIEIVLQRSPSPEPESIPEDDAAEHLEDIPLKENKKENLEIEDEIRSEADHFDKPQAYNNGGKREVSGRRGPFVGSIHELAVPGDRVPHFSETETEEHLDSRNRTSSYPSKKHNSPHNHIDRPMKRTASSRSPRLTDNQNEESIESVDHKQSHSSSPVTIGSADDRSFDQNDTIKDVVTAENTNDKDTLKDEKSRHKMKKQKLFTRAEHSSVERGEDREDSIHSGSFRKPVKEPRGRDERQERERPQMAMKGMEDQYSQRKWESNQGYRSHPKSENYDRKKGREPEGVWLDDMRKRSHKARENERSDKNEYRSRKQLENGGWKGDHDRDLIPVLKRDEGLKTQTRHHTIPEGMQSKREESLHSHRESSSRPRKRERERDDNLQREKVERQREREEWKEREKDKSWLGHTRLKEDSRSSNKEYPFKETGWDPISKRGKFENETVSRHRGRDDVYAHGNKINNEERISSRHERGYSGSAKDMPCVLEKKHNETLKKGKETDAAIYNSLATSRRNREDHSSQKSDRVSSRGNLEQRASDQTRKSSKRQKEKESASSEDEESKKGRSKLERWTSHKEVDFSHDIKETAVKYKDNNPPTKLREESIKPQENMEKSKPLVVEEKAEDAKPSEDKHLDTAEKLKKRSERFKLPMPSEKEALAIKKMENEPLPSAQPETRPESDVKPERPARKRRWTSS